MNECFYCSRKFVVQQIDDFVIVGKAFGALMPVFKEKPCSNENENENRPDTISTQVVLGRFVVKAIRTVGRFVPKPFRPKNYLC